MKISLTVILTTILSWNASATQNHVEALISNLEPLLSLECNRPAPINQPDHSRLYVFDCMEPNGQHHSIEISDYDGGHMPGASISGISLPSESQEEFLFRLVEVVGNASANDYWKPFMPSAELVDLETFEFVGGSAGSFQLRDILQNVVAGENAWLFDVITNTISGGTTLIQLSVVDGKVVLFTGGFG